MISGYLSVTVLEIGYVWRLSRREEVPRLVSRRSRLYEHSSNHVSIYRGCFWTDFISLWEKRMANMILGWSKDRP